MGITIILGIGMLYKPDLESFPILLQRFVQKDNLWYPLGSRMQGTCKSEIADCSLAHNVETTSLKMKAIWMSVEKETETSDAVWAPGFSHTCEYWILDTSMSILVLKASKLFSPSKLVCTGYLLSIRRVLISENIPCFAFVESHFICEFLYYLISILAELIIVPFGHSSNVVYAFCFKCVSSS